MFFFFNDTATTEIYTLSLHDALPISGGGRRSAGPPGRAMGAASRTADGRADHLCPGDAVPPSADLSSPGADRRAEDRKSTRLNSSHANISYAVFCLKKKKNKNYKIHP